MHMKDGWRVAEPVLAAQPVESPTLSEAAAVALARDEDLENLRFVFSHSISLSNSSGCFVIMCNSSSSLALGQNQQPFLRQ